MKSKQLLIVLLPIVFLFATCKEYDLDLPPKDCLRIKKITEHNEIDNWVKMHSYAYDKNKLTELKSYILNENNKPQEYRKITFMYEENRVEVNILNKKEGCWHKHQKCEIKMHENLITEKLVSRYSDPTCVDCWKYEYSYIGNKLAESKKYFKQGAEGFEILEAKVYKHENDTLREIQWFQTSNEGELTLDYLQIYSYQNNICQSCLEGIVLDSNNWIQTQKIEYSFTQDKLRTRKCYRLNDQLEWFLAVETNFAYDINGKLIEKRSSPGGQCYYEYEKGKGNSSLFFNCPTEIVQPGFIHL